jgi:hypothetical protein
MGCRFELIRHNKTPPILSATLGYILFFTQRYPEGKTVDDLNMMFFISPHLLHGKYALQCLNIKGII